MANSSIGAYQINVDTGAVDAPTSIGAYQVEYVEPEVETDAVMFGTEF